MKLKKVFAVSAAVTVALSSVMGASAATLRDLFDADYYAAVYGDVREKFGSDEDALYSHFVEHGIGEKRKASQFFDIEAYRAMYSDLEKAFGDDWAAYYWHYLTHGAEEGRNPFTEGFDFREYADRYPDLRELFGYNAVALYKHYLTAGKDEGRNCAAPTPVPVQQESTEDTDSSVPEPTQTPDDTVSGGDTAGDGNTGDSGNNGNTGDNGNNGDSGDNGNTGDNGEEQDPSVPKWEESGLEDHVMDWKDENLEAAMREQTEITDRDIMLSDVWEMTYLSAGDSYHDISDISALGELTNLTGLSVCCDGASDISVLGELTNLTELRVHCDGAGDISALGNLTNLTSLYISSSKVNDIEALGRLTNLSSLYLDVMYGDLTNIDVVGELKNLTYFAMHHNIELKDYSVLEQLPNLKELSITFCGEVETLGDLNVEKIILFQTGFSDCNFDLKQIEIFDVGESRIHADVLNALKNQPKLKTLSLRKVNFVNSEGKVTAFGEQEMEILGSMTDLTSLSLAGCKITSVDALSGLTGLTWLDLSRNQITNVDALSELTGLTYLDLRDNQISDVSALSELEEAGVEVILDGNPVAE